MFAKYYIKKEIRRIKKGLSRIDRTDPDLKELGTWKLAIDKLATDIFGKDADFVKSLSYRKVMPISLIYVFPGVTEYTLEEKLLHKSKQQYKLVEQLNEIKEAIRKCGVPYEFKAPFRKILIEIVVVPLVIGIVTTFGGIWCSDYLETRRVEVEANRQATIVLSKFYLWHKNDDARFIKSFDSLVNKIASNNMGISGVDIQWLVRFCEDQRRQRDITIDSFLIELSATGISLDTIRVERKLPANKVGPVIKRWIKQLDIGASMGAYYDLGVDTL